MTCIKQKQVLLSLIEAYKNMPYLWKRDNMDYLNKDLRETGFATLLHIYQEFDEHATLKVVKKKIENMRTNYMKELRKVEESIDDGRTSDLYVPSLWYYDALRFLGEPSQLAREDREDTDPLESVEASLDYEDESITTSVRKRIKIEPRAKKLECAPGPSENLRNSQMNDQWEVYGKNIGYQVRDLSDHQLVICQKLISDVIFYAKLSKLNEDSHIVNPVNSFESE